MGDVIILDTTTKNPITTMGERAGICFGTDITDPELDYKRGKRCLKSGHYRLLEFVNVEMILEGWSARVIREWYTHIGGSPTRLQESTRRMCYTDFEYIIPETIKTNEQLTIYENCMEDIQKAMKGLQNLGIPMEDVANLLPLGMKTTIVDRRNARNLMDMSRQRLCNKTYWEYRNLMNMILTKLSEVSDEWKELINEIMYPKCDELGYCPESKSCGRKEKK